MATKKRPIIFSAESVRAILAGTKTQTRRLCKRAFDHGGEPAKSVHPDGSGTGWIAWFGPFEVSAEETVKRYPGAEGFLCPHGVPGDRLWVREVWQTPKDLDECTASQMAAKAEEAGYRQPWAPMLYKADGSERDWDHNTWPPAGRQRLPMFMPRWASRIDLKVVGVLVERLQNIRCSDIRAEGIGCPVHDFPGGLCVSECEGLRAAFGRAWDILNGKRAPWASNPWVWRIEFRRVG